MSLPGVTLATERFSRVPREPTTQVADFWAGIAYVSCEKVAVSLLRDGISSKMSGAVSAVRLDAFDYIARPVLDYLSRQLGLPAPGLTTLCVPIDAR